MLDNLYDLLFMSEIDSQSSGSIIIHNSYRTESSDYSDDGSNLDVLNCQSIFPISLKKFPVLERYLSNLWVDEPTLMVRFVSIITQYFNLIFLIEDKQYVNIKKDPTYIALLNFHLKQCEKMVLINNDCELILHELAERIADLVSYLLNEINDERFIEQCQLFINSVDQSLRIIAKMI